MKVKWECGIIWDSNSKLWLILFFICPHTVYHIQMYTYMYICVLIYVYIYIDKESILCKGEFASASPSIQSTTQDELALIW